MKIYIKAERELAEGRGIMSRCVSGVVKLLKKQGITKVGALCELKNKQSLILLNNFNFKLKETNDLVAGYYIAEL